VVVVLVVNLVLVALQQQIMESLAQLELVVVEEVLNVPPLVHLTKLVVTVVQVL
jgi:hypothetical protein